MNELFLKPQSVLYDPQVYNPDPINSYWEATAPQPGAAEKPLQEDCACDVAVIGGGYTGLATALHLARDYHVDVRVLEAGNRMGWGASGRNGGFACMPAAKMGIGTMLSKYGEEETKRFFKSQIEGMEYLKKIEAEEGLSFDRVGDGNIEVACSPKRTEEVHEYGRTLKKLFGIESTPYDQAGFAERFHTGTEQFGGLHIHAGFALHPLKLAHGIATAAAKHGAKLHPSSPVGHWERSGGMHRLVTPGGTVTAKRVVVATNGFTREGLHPEFDGRLLPALSNIIVTRPLSDEELAAHSWKTDNPIVNTRNLLFYYRKLPDNRILFGARGDLTGSPEDGRKMRFWMEKRFREVFPQWDRVGIDYFWRGLVCVTQRFLPSAGRLGSDPSVFYGLAYHANGVNTAPWTGSQLARLIAGNESEEAIFPALLRGMPPRFFMPQWRLLYLRAAYWYYRFKDLT